MLAITYDCLVKWLAPFICFTAEEAWLARHPDSDKGWDDDWRCIGGSQALIDAILAEPGFEARRVGLDEDAPPPGHTAR